MTRMNHFLLQVTGKDRPGILAAVTQVLYISGCNLEDLSVAHVGRDFAFLMRFVGPENLSEAAVSRSLERVGREYDLRIEVRVLGGAEAKPPKAGRLALISVHGPDRPGMLFRLSSALAKLKVNLIEVNTHRMAESRHKPGAVLFLEAEMPAKMDEDALKRKLSELGKEMGLTITLKPERGGR